jgi:hypothetical protein
VSRAAQRRLPPTRIRARVNLVVDPRAKAQLERTANMGRYVDFALAERERVWRAALGALRAAGWSAGAVFAAREALGEAVPADPGAVRAALLAFRTRAAQDWGVPAPEWSGRLGRAADGELLALRELAREADAGNGAVPAAIAELEGEASK